MATMLLQELRIKRIIIILILYNKRVRPVTLRKVVKKKMYMYNIYFTVIMKVMF